MRFAALTQTLQRRFHESLTLSALPTEPRFEAAEGRFRGRPAWLSSRTFAGGGLRFARFVTVTGDGLDIGNVLCIPEPTSPLPIFGADVVGLGADAIVAAADLSPMSHGLPLPQLPSHTLPSPNGELPPWAARWFSPQAFVTRTHVGQAAGVERVVTGYAEAFLGLLAARAPAGSDLTEAHLAYCRDHREQDRALGMLRKIFGEAFSREFLSTVLFPEVLS
ncbi:MAG: hypothetical protein JNK82_27770 [Myxococcaceae bacterium]|nr:hypothetical protein [Myxococcaceae bacterium]